MSRFLLPFLLAALPFCGAAAAAAPANGPKISVGRTPALKVRRTGSATPAAHTPEQSRQFSLILLKTVAAMPRNGGYSVSDQTIDNLSFKAVVWNDSLRRLDLNMQAAQPSFCSAACYLVLLNAVKRWQQETRTAWPAAAWQALDITRQEDGRGVWGRANANGPGFAKLVHDIGAGVSFTDIRKARAGDFLKFFWTEDIGCKERGHMVIYLGAVQKDGGIHIRYWSSNTPDGYSERLVPLNKMHHLIFTRIVSPNKLAEAAKLPEIDPWLRDMQTREVSFEEVVAKCGLIVPKATVPKP